MDIDAINFLYRTDFLHHDLVLGEGKKDAAIMLIGEAPGREEVEQRRPFVGKAGKNLTEFLQLIDLPRSEIFISNAVKFRPTKTSAYGTISNRTPTEAEISEFLPYLLKEIEAANPSLVVTLGNTPLQALLGKGVTVGRLHGQVQPLGTRKLFPLFHPASIIYNPQLKDVYTEDILRLRDYIAEHRLNVSEGA